MPFKSAKQRKNMTENIKFHKRVDGKCICKPPLVCSVLPNRFWCGTCGKNLKSLSKKSLALVANVVGETWEERKDDIILKFLGIRDVAI